MHWMYPSVGTDVTKQNWGKQVNRERDITKSKTENNHKMVLLHVTESKPMGLLCSNGEKSSAPRPSLANQWKNVNA